MIRRLFALLGTTLAAAPSAAADLPPRCGYEVLQSFPHDRQAFTEGLFYLRDRLFESTGEVGRSTIREVRLEDGHVLRSVKTAPELFGEGIVNWKNELVSVTWKTQKGFRWDLRTFRKKSEFTYAGEGWGLTQDGARIIMSDGTPYLRFFNPSTMKETGKITVMLAGKPIRLLNELEWVKGEIYANVWHTNYILRIDPRTGAVRSVIDLAGLREQAEGNGPEDVANGIAYDAAKDRLFVTGKDWSKLFQIKVIGC